MAGGSGQWPFKYSVGIKKKNKNHFGVGKGN